MEEFRNFLLFARYWWGEMSGTGRTHDRDKTHTTFRSKNLNAVDIWEVLGVDRKIILK
jgi:hypothetical protein